MFFIDSNLTFIITKRAYDYKTIYLSFFFSSLSLFLSPSGVLSLVFLSFPPNLSFKNLLMYINMNTCIIYIYIIYIYEPSCVIPK